MKTNDLRLYKGYYLSGDILQWHHYEYGLFWISTKGVRYWYYMARNLHTNKIVYVSNEDELLEIMQATYTEYKTGDKAERKYRPNVDNKWFVTNVARMRDDYVPVEQREE